MSEQVPEPTGEVGVCGVCHQRMDMRDIVIHLAVEHGIPAKEIADAPIIDLTEESDDRS
jgi:hypothetical protein